MANEDRHGSDAENGYFTGGGNDDQIHTHGKCTAEEIPKARRISSSGDRAPLLLPAFLSPFVIWTSAMDLPSSLSDVTRWNPMLGVGEQVESLEWEASDGRLGRELGYAWKRISYGLWYGGG